MIEAETDEIDAIAGVDPETEGVDPDPETAMEADMVTQHMVHMVHRLVIHRPMCTRTRRHHFTVRRMTPTDSPRLSAARMVRIGRHRLATQLARMDIRHQVARCHLQWAALGRSLQGRLRQATPTLPMLRFLLGHLRPITRPSKVVAPHSTRPLETHVIGHGYLSSRLHIDMRLLRGR